MDKPLNLKVPHSIQNNLHGQPLYKKDKSLGPNCQVCPLSGGSTTLANIIYAYKTLDHPHMLVSQVVNDSYNVNFMFHLDLLHCNIYANEYSCTSNSRAASIYIRIMQRASIPICMAYRAVGLLEHCLESCNSTSLSCLQFGS